MRRENCLILAALSLLVISCGESFEKTSQILEKENTQEEKVEPLLRKSNSLEAVAKMKKIPAIIKRNGIEHKLVSVIEGEQATARFTLLLQETNKIKRRLQQLSAEYNKLTDEAPAQKELIATEINSSKKQYVAYLSDLAKNYGYSMEFNYVLEPYQCRYTTGNKEEDVKLESSEEYTKLEQLRAQYVQLVTAEKQDDEGKAMAEEVKQTLDQDYGFDIMKNYTLYISKAGLYGCGVKK